LVGKDDEQGEVLTREKAQEKKRWTDAENEDNDRDRDRTTRQESRLGRQDYDSRMDALRLWRELVTGENFCIDEKSENKAVT
jgi:hypothetical protein